MGRQAYDGAASMSGYVSGLVARIQQEEQAALFVHCFANTGGNLCLKTAGMQIITTRAALDLVQELTVFIPFSPKRTSSLEI